MGAGRARSCWTDMDEDRLTERAEMVLALAPKTAKIPTEMAQRRDRSC